MLVLASRSTTRKTLLENAGIRFSVAQAQIDERRLENRALDSGADSAAVAQALAEAKALAVGRSRPGTWVIGADQTLDCDGESLHKPADREAARRQLMKLRGKSHILNAAFALVRDGTLIARGVDRARLTMREFSGQELDQVLALEGETILSSVGGYRLEGASVRLLAAVEGDYFTVLGLPLLMLLEALREHAPQILSGSDNP